MRCQSDLPSGINRTDVCICVFIHAQIPARECLRTCILSLLPHTRDKILISKTLKIQLYDYRVGESKVTIPQKETENGRKEGKKRLTEEGVAEEKKARDQSRDRKRETESIACV